MDNFKNELQMARVMLKAKRRLSAQDKLEKLVNELKPMADNQSENLFEVLVTLADLLNTMDYLESSLDRRNEAINLAIKLFGLKHNNTVDQLISRANTSWILLDKQEERSMIIKCANDSVTFIRDAVKVLTMMPTYPNRDNIIEEMRQRLTCAMMIVKANSQIDAMIQEKQKPIEDNEMLDEPYPI